MIIIIIIIFFKEVYLILESHSTYILCLLVLHSQVDLFSIITVSLSKRTKSNTIILAGLSGSGKTTLFYQV